ncbi:ketol-acid reductoisomerase [Helicobacter baculiformis]|uniref:Ketol-acid reductoisomerase (NADP(+)) n=1 Tax=Helicobacter baculiformis TaxID=427351 RepID=A0ABV7ZFG4_9HELI|nr:ketol-acid reductoisomerase [Helicobacter baculiformis]
MSRGAGFLPIYTDKDSKVSLITSKCVAVLGYGAQGRAHALNLRDSGVHVLVGLYAGSPSIALAKEEGFEVCSVAECVQASDVLAFMLPDESHARVYTQEIAPFLKPGQTLLFAHGFSVYFKHIQPPEGVGVILVAPKGPGYALRENYQQGSGLFALIAIHQDNVQHNAKELALSYACAIGSGRLGILETSFKHEACSDLFGEQVVLCGGLVSLLQKAFEVLVEAGYPAELAYFECVHEIKLIADLLYSKGLARMQEHISNTAEYGGLVSGERVVDAQSKARMHAILAEIENGDFARAFMQESAEHYPTMRAHRKALQDQLLEAVGAHLRAHLFKA